MAQSRVKKVILHGKGAVAKLSEAKRNEKFSFGEGGQ
jgi:hypothetical protein